MGCNHSSMVTLETPTEMIYDDSVDDVTDADSDDSCPMQFGTSGNHMIPFPSLVSMIQQCTTCTFCDRDKLDDMFESFLSYCESEVSKIKENNRNRSLEWQVTVLKQLFDVRGFHKE
jgi:hypothetical protein